MKKIRGFTMVEMVVVLMITALVILGATTFMVYQSQYGRDAALKRRAREAVSLAVVMLKNDLLHAGYGLSSYPKLALYADDEYPPGTPSYYKTLYVNYGRWRKVGDYEKEETIFDKPAYLVRSDDTSVGTYNPNKTLYLVRNEDDYLNAFTAYDAVSMQNLIVLNSAGVFPTTDPVITGIKCCDGVRKADGSFKQPSDDPNDYCESDPGTCVSPKNPIDGYLYAPAVRYWANDATGRLMRNDTPLVGMKQNVWIERMEIRLMFLNDNGSGGYTEQWAPRDGSFADWNISRLATVQVILRYVINDPSRREAQPGTTRMKGTRVSSVYQITPRPLSFTAYK